MPSSKEYLDYVADQLRETDDVTVRPMMGEYLLYYRGKVVGGIYDDRFLVKDTPSARALMPTATTALPYEGGKEMLLVSDPDDRELLRGLFEGIYSDLPEKKKKK